MRFAVVFYFFTLVLLFRSYSAEKFVLEAEDALFDGGRNMAIVHRSEASNLKAVSSRKGDIFRFHFCLSSANKVRIEDVRYSNDGHSDTFVLLDVDGRHIARIESVPRFLKGMGWNDFISLDKPLDYFVSSAGMHTLTLEILEADAFGVEIDNVVLSVANEANIDSFKCQMFCMDDSLKTKPAMKQSKKYQNAWIEQRSTQTKCAEEDNINIPVYGVDINAFTITASAPDYRSHVNNRNPDFTDCTMLTALWSFENIIFENGGDTHSRFHKSSIGPKHTKHKDGDVAALIAGYNSERMMIDIVFKLEGMAAGVVDADIGSVLHVTIRRVKGAVVVVMQYRGRSRNWSAGEAKLVTGDDPHQTWDIPDFTWLENVENDIRVEIHTWERTVEIEKIELKRRYHKPTRIFHMYDDGEHLVEGADIDFWWLINKTMTVRILDTGEEFHEADYFRIYSRIPWTGHDFAQIFVIYQDGNIRLLPYPSREFDWIPFGSSVLIGQTDPSLHRPFASIKRIDMIMKQLKLWVYFEDGGYATFQIITNANQTIIEVTNINFVKDRYLHPLVTFRSMWVTNGNSDVDHVIADGQSDNHILSDWHRLEGSSFEFYRKCISKHNTQSPDISIQIKP